MGKSSIIEVKHLFKNYYKQLANGKKDEIEVLKCLDFQVKKGEFLGIMGKSGCGKTTLLKVLGMIDRTYNVYINFIFLIILLALTLKEC